jgi:Cu/Ag efflux pump CusA
MPILLTTAMTVLGMTPLLWGGTAMFEPMAITIIFGLTFATALTLLVTPVLYAMFFFGFRFLIASDVFLKQALSAHEPNKNESEE